MSSYTRISTSVRSSPPRALYFFSVQCEPPRASHSVAGARPAGLCTSAYFSTVRVPTAFVRCEPTKALYRHCALYEPHELCAVRAYKGFVPLCAVRAPRAFFGASLQRLYTVCARACASGTVRASRALCGASLQRLYTVLCTNCTSLTSFVRCEPTKALYNVLVFALQALHRVRMCPCGRMSR